MWGGFMDKATKMAAALDQQINESVGMDVEGGVAAVAVGASAAADAASDINASSSKLPLVSEASNTEEANEYENENAWNKDFDQDFDSDQDDFDQDFDSDQDDDEKQSSQPVKTEPQDGEIPQQTPGFGGVFSKLAQQAEARLDTAWLHRLEEADTRPTGTAHVVQHKPVPDEDLIASQEDAEEHSVHSGNHQDIDVAEDHHDLIPTDQLEQVGHQSPRDDASPLPPQPPTDETQIEDNDDDMQENQIQQQQQQQQLPHSETSPQPPCTPTTTNDATAYPEITTTLLGQEDESVLIEETTFPSALTSQQLENSSMIQLLQEQLRLREEQLASKSEQLAQLQVLSEEREQELKAKINETKEEAKKRIVKAKERCEAAEAKLKRVSQSQAAAEQSEHQQQAKTIAALREEGQKLALKQAQMEQSVRNAKIEARDCSEGLERETKAKEQALEKIQTLETELNLTKESLSAARRGESQAGKLEQDILAARADAEQKATQILSLHQQVKELSAENKELRVEMEATRKTTLQRANQEKKSMRREHNDVITDLEQRLRTTEREAGVREDALRHEVSELRKRWQDAVRRADALSMDVQSSTVPLLRQLESMERQSRARATAWAELETRLRSELEEAVIQNESLSKERSEFKTKLTRLERSMTESENELKHAKRTIDELSAKINRLELERDEIKADAEKRQEEYTKVEQLANEGVMRVRSEMTQTVMDSEERYRGRIEKLETDLRMEREKRAQLESQVEDLLENAGMVVATHPMETALVRKETKQKKLRQAEGQAEILAGALLGLDSDDDDDNGMVGDENDDDDDDFLVGHGMDRGERGEKVVSGSFSSSFTALEQLTSRLKAAKMELESLRCNLRDSESTRDSLVEELGQCRSAKEKLPLFEAKVKELTEENREKELEITGLREDISEVRELYRAQLNILLEEKASKSSGGNCVPNGGVVPSDGSVQVVGAAMGDENGDD